MPEPIPPRAVGDHFQNKSRAESPAQHEFSTHFNALSSATIGSLRCHSHSSSCLCVLGHKNPPSFLSVATFIFQKALVFVEFHVACCPAHFFVVLVTILTQSLPATPLWITWQKACQSVHERRSPPVLCNVINIDARFFGANFFSERQFLLPELTPRGGPFRTLPFVPQRTVYLPSDGPLPKDNDCPLFQSFSSPT